MPLNSQLQGRVSVLLLTLVSRESKRLADGGTSGWSENDNAEVRAGSNV